MHLVGSPLFAALIVSRGDPSSRLTVGGPANFPRSLASSPLFRGVVWDIQRVYDRVQRGWISENLPHFRSVSFFVLQLIGENALASFGRVYFLIPSRLVPLLLPLRV